jgi:glycosyltransferase involved in cell wall biosynthesis
MARSGSWRALCRYLPQATWRGVCGDLLRDGEAWRQYRDAGRAAVQKNHDPARIAAAYEELYRRIA